LGLGVLVVNLPGFIGPAYTSISRAINCQRAVNLRLEVDLANGKAPVSLVGLPGYHTLKSDFPAASVRGLWLAQDRGFAVVGNKLYEFLPNWTHVERGTLTTSVGPVSIADNGLQMIVVDGFGHLLLDLETNETENAIPNFPPLATHIVNVDSTFVANEGGTQRFAISAVGDGYTWNPIDFASVEAAPDDLVAIVAFNRQLYMMGTRSMQVFWNSGDAARPFVPVDGSYVEIGCTAVYSAAFDETGVYFLGADLRGGPRIYKANGGSVAPISTPALDVELTGYELNDAKGYTYRMDGHTFYVLNFPTADKTWVYDATTEGWSEFLEWDSATATWERHRSNCALYAYGRQIIGDISNGKLYELNSSFYDNDGRPLRAVRASAHVHQQQEQLIVGNLEVLTEHGVGTQTGQGFDPQMMLRTSKDGGFNWTPETKRPIGRVGAYRGRTRWNRPCGVARDIVFEVSITDPVKRVIIGAAINVV
jgi:hypothetical protein